MLVLRPSSSSVTLCIVAKRCVQEQKLLLTAYRKSYMYMRNRLVPKWMTLSSFKVAVQWTIPPHSPLNISKTVREIETWFQRTANKKLSMRNQMTSRDSERSNSVLCPSVVCNVCIVLWLNVASSRKLSEEANRKWSMGNRCRYVTPKGQGCDHNMLRAQYLGNG